MGKLKRENMIQFVDADKILFDGVNVDWCAIYKLNEIVALNIIRTLELFQIRFYFNVRLIYFER